jgi:hypothetical protein
MQETWIWHEHQGLWSWMLQPRFDYEVLNEGLAMQRPILERLATQQIEWVQRLEILATETVGIRSGNILFKLMDQEYDLVSPIRRTAERPGNGYDGTAGKHPDRCRLPSRRRTSLRMPPHDRARSRRASRRWRALQAASQAAAVPLKNG